jgi:hypothetical protein
MAAARQRLVDLRAEKRKAEARERAELGRRFCALFPSVADARAQLAQFEAQRAAAVAVDDGRDIGSSDDAADIPEVGAARAWGV